MSITVKQAIAALRHHLADDINALVTVDLIELGILHVMGDPLRAERRVIDKRLADLHTEREQAITDGNEAKAFRAHHDLEALLDRRHALAAIIEAEKQLA